MAFLTEAANRGSISTGYDIDNSLKFERANSEKLSRTPSSAGNLRTWTYSFWVKRTQLGINSYHLEAKGSGDKFFILGFNENDQILFYDIYSSDYGKAFTRRFRDTSAWYHIVLRADTTNGTAGNRMRLYVNGVQETAVTSDYGDFPQNHDTQINKTVVHNIGYRTDINQYASGYMAETCLIDGTSLGPDSFGQLDSATGIWKPIDVSGLTFGTNGFYQEYKSSSALGADTVPGGNSIDYTTSNIAAADQATDTPTNNFAVPNILVGTGGFFVITEGATKGVLSTAGPGNNTGGVSLVSTIPVSNGKWYFEAQNTNSGDVYLYLGVADTGSIAYTDGKTLGGSGSNPSVAWRGGGAFGGNSKVAINNVVTGDSVTWETEVVGVALDLDNGKIYFHKSGTYINSGNPASGTDNGGQYDLPTAEDDQWLLGVSAYNLATWNVNFGGYTTMSISSAATDANGYGTFEYAPPSGYYALCSKNLAEYG